MNYKEIKSVFEYLGANEIYMSENQISFVGSLWKYFKTNKKLSEKQIFILNEITKYIQKKDVPVTEKTLF